LAHRRFRDRIQIQPVNECCGNKMINWNHQYQIIKFCKDEAEIIDTTNDKDDAFDLARKHYKNLESRRRVWKIEVFNSMARRGEDDIWYVERYGDQLILEPQTVRRKPIAEIPIDKIVKEKRHTAVPRRKPRTGGNKPGLFKMI